MGLFSDLLFGTETPENKKRLSTGNWNDLADDYEDYYEELHDDAIGGDQSAIDEMHEEFGDDWDEEY